MSGFLLSDAELHGLIDGQIGVHHRADILRRAAASTADRERIGSWQSQCELIRSAFRGIDREPLPSVLDLRAPARLHAVATSPLVQCPDDVPPIVVVAPPRRRLMLPSLAALVAAAGLLATWFAGGFSLRAPEAVVADEKSARHSAVQAVSATAAPVALPTTTIPDLTSLGFALTAADVQAGDPASMLFHYRDADAAEITLGVTRSDDPPAAGTSRPVSVGQSLVWHAGTRSYSLAGDVQPDQLRALAPAVRDLAVEE